jgi:hypothetical protein
MKGKVILIQNIKGESLMNSPTVTVRIPIDILEKCKQTIKEGKHKNMSELIKRALICYLNLNIQDYFFEP